MEFKLSDIPPELLTQLVHSDLGQKAASAIKAGLCSERWPEWPHVAQEDIIQLFGKEPQAVPEIFLEFCFKNPNIIERHFDLFMRAHANRMDILKAAQERCRPIVCFISWLKRQRPEEKYGAITGCHDCSVKF